MIQNSGKNRALHEEALRVSRNFFKAEFELLEVLQRLDITKAFRDYGSTSLFQYSITILKLSESTALNFINVARKALQVPQLKEEIKNGNLSVSKARKIVPVLDAKTSLQAQQEWIEKAKTLTSKKLEQAVAESAPKEATPESARFVTENRRALRMGMNEIEFQKLKRVQDLESQRQKRAVSMEEAIEAMMAVYLEAKDPVRKAKRAIERSEKKVQSVKSAELSVRSSGVVSVARQTNLVESPASLVSSRSQRTAIPALNLHQARLRDQGRCTQTSENIRCEQKRWIDIHHVKPLSQGGTHNLDNLKTLCAEHHRQEHSKM